MLNEEEARKEANQIAMDYSVPGSYQREGLEKDILTALRSRDSKAREEEREKCAALFPCMACKRGEKAELIDEHGTLASISGLPGRLGHCQDDFFWECSASIILRDATAAQAIREGGEGRKGG